jgi:hypothetical protein
MAAVSTVVAPERFNASVLLHRNLEAGRADKPGRADDMLKIDGLWVSPVDMENALMEHPLVQGAAVPLRELAGTGPPAGVGLAIAGDPGGASLAILTELSASHRVIPTRWAEHRRTPSNEGGEQLCSAPPSPSPP